MIDPNISWRCFHCGDNFTDANHAAAHFGIDQLATPGCVAVLRHGEQHLLEKIIRQERELALLRAEDTELVRWQWFKDSQSATHITAAEQKGYDKGVAQMRDQLHEAVTLLHRLYDDNDNVTFTLGDASRIEDLLRNYGDAPSDEVAPLNKLLNDLEAAYRTLRAVVKKS